MKNEYLGYEDDDIEFEIDYADLDLNDTQILKTTSSYLFDFYQKDISKHHRRAQLRMIQDERKLVDEELGAKEKEIIGLGKNLLDELNNIRGNEQLIIQINHTKELINFLLGGVVSSGENNLYQITPKKSKIAAYKKIEQCFARALDLSDVNFMPLYKVWLSFLFKDHTLYRYKSIEYLILTKMINSINNKTDITDYYNFESATNITKSVSSSMKPHKDHIYYMYDILREKHGRGRHEDAFLELIEEVKKLNLDITDYINTEEALHFDRSYREWKHKNFKKGSRLPK